MDARKAVAGMTDYLVPGVLLLCAVWALRRHEDGYAALLDGAKSGLKIVAAILPSLVVLLTAVSMLHASGAATLVGEKLAPLFAFLGIPPECALLVLIRPISGSAALAVGTQLMTLHGVDSLVGRTAAVMLGSTETTFYTLSVYFGAAGVRKTRYALPAALLADLVGFLAASWTTRLFFAD